jgi:hypothetical protein
MSFDSLLIDTSDIIDRVLDKWGGLVSETVTPAVPCRIEYKNRLLRDFKGEEVLSYAQVFYRPDVALSQNSRIRFDGKEWSPIRLERQQDSVGIHHIEVWVS